MNPRLKKLLIFGSLSAVILILYLIIRLSDRTLYNASPVTGNTAGNLYNGGLFCEYDNMIYFGNDKDEGRLYRMSSSFKNVKKISSDKTYYLNIDANYIYYSKANYTIKKDYPNPFNYYNSGLYRMNKNGSQLKQLASKPIGLSGLCGNYLYFQQFDKTTGLSLCKVKIDGSGYQLLSTDNIEPASFKEGILYFSPGSTSDNHMIHAYNTATDTDSIVYSGNCYLPVAGENGIFYISLEDNYSICFLPYETYEKKVLVKEFCSTYNMSPDETILYYQVDGGDKNRIAKMDLTSMTETTILEGDYKNIHVIGIYVFFRDFNETTTYVYNTETGSVSIFVAPAEK